MGDLMGNPFVEWGAVVTIGGFIGFVLSMIGLAMVRGTWNFFRRKLK